MARKETAWGAWDHYPPEKVFDLLDGIGVEWWVAGGYAIEAFLGRSIREHDDIDISLWHPEQAAIQRQFPGWHITVADPPGTLRDWLPGEPLSLEIHDIWIREDLDSPWRIQFMLNERDGDDWLFRRDHRVHRPISEALWTKDGVRYLAPEIQLLYKSKGQRPKDIVDFEEAGPALSLAQRSWLRTALQQTDAEHPWLPLLS